MNDHKYLWSSFIKRITCIATTVTIGSHLYFSPFALVLWMNLLVSIKLNLLTDFNFNQKRKYGFRSNINNQFVYRKSTLGAVCTGLVMWLIHHLITKMSRLFIMLSSLSLLTALLIRLDSVENERERRIAPSTFTWSLSIRSYGINSRCGMCSHDERLGH